MKIIQLERHWSSWTLLFYTARSIIKRYRTLDFSDYDYYINVYWNDRSLEFCMSRVIKQSVEKLKSWSFIPAWNKYNHFANVVLFFIIVYFVTLVIARRYYIYSENVCTTNQINGSVAFTLLGWTNSCE